MNIFTANQVNQVYVLKTDSTVVANLDASNKVDKTNKLGTVGLGKTPDGKSIYFKHLGAGGLTRSDLIEIANIMNVKATPAKAMARNLVTAKVTLNSEALNASKPIAGQDYVLRLKFQNPIGMSPDNQYWKYGVVHGVSSMTASDFYVKMAGSVAKNMSRDAVQLVKVFVTTGSAETEVTAETDLSTLRGTYNGIVIKEVEQDWILGIKQQKPLVFSVEPTWVTNDTDEVVWGDVIYSNGKKTTGGVSPENGVATAGLPDAAGTIVNSKLMADYEYFYMGERGDQYRMVNWPDYIPTTYLVDPTLEYGYDTVAIHFAYVGDNHAVQKSEKDITFIVPRGQEDSDDGEIGSLADQIVTAIEKATSLKADVVTMSVKEKIAVAPRNTAKTETKE